jgi:[ribosomal protein S5]-alanine N-acetyltransferase
MPVPIPVTPPEPALRDDAVALRPWRRQDLAALIAARPSTEADALAWLAAESERMRGGDGLTLAVVGRDGETPLGNIGLRVIPDDRDVAEFAYNGAPSARGRGVDAAALRLLAAWALREWGLARLQLATLIDDVESQRASEQAGFHREGVLRSWSELDRRRLDMVMFSLLPGDL